MLVLAQRKEQINKDENDNISLHTNNNRNYVLASYCLRILYLNLNINFSPKQIYK